MEPGHQVLRPRLHHDERLHQNREARSDDY
jgi:hypothetical protein